MGLCEARCWPPIFRIVPYKLYSVPMLLWSHGRSHLHHPNGFCIVGSALNTTFLDQSTLWPFCWSWDPAFEASASNIELWCKKCVPFLPAATFHTVWVKFGQRMARNLPSSEVSDISASFWIANERWFIQAASSVKRKMPENFLCSTSIIYQGDISLTPKWVR